MTDSFACSGTSWLSKPQEYGNAAGESIQNTLGKVGEPLGNGLSYAVAPVGNVVESVVGGVMKAPDVLNDAPEWGGNAETQARDTAGKIMDQGKDVLDKGQETVQEKKEENKPVST